MIHRYAGGNQYMPHHSDSEPEIEVGSQIVTISFGESRVMEFKNIATSERMPVIVEHGDVILMDQSSQYLYSHSILPSSSMETRISVTFRNIVPQRPPDSHSDSVNTNITEFLVTLGKHDDHSDFGLDNQEQGSFAAASPDSAPQHHSPPPLCSNGYQASTPTYPHAQYYIPHNNGYSTSYQAPIRPRNYNSVTNYGYQDINQMRSFNHHNTGGRPHYANQANTQGTKNINVSRPPNHFNSHQNRGNDNRNESRAPGMNFRDRTTRHYDEHTVYISSSMFRYLDPIKLSSQAQKAHVFS